MIGSSTRRGTGQGPSCACITRRSGTVLLLVVAALFLLLPLAALVLHFGTVSTTRRQMQAASDLAARETLRLRDDRTDLERRTFAIDAAATLFDDDLDPASGDARRFGAGPTMTFSGTPPQVRIGSYGVYDPALQANTSDDAAGDLVAGEYDATATDHSEASDYTRLDFTPASASSAATVSPAVLVRLRRSNESFPTGIGSSGPPVPQLFGRGPFGGSASPGAPTFAERGTTVRATSIAAASAAWTVGPENPTLAVVGVSDLAIEATAWHDATLDWTGGVTVEIASGDSAITTSGGRSIGFTLASSPTSSGSRAISVGQTIAAELVSPVETSRTVFVPLVVATSATPTSATTQRIAGFGQLDVRPLSVAGDDPVRVSLTRATTPIVAAENASATCLVSPYLDDDADADQIAEALAVFATLQSQSAGLVQAPSQRRTIE